MAESKSKASSARAKSRAAPKPAPASGPKPPPGAGHLALSDRTPALEWIAAGVGLVVALAAIAFLTWQSLQPHPETAVVRAVARAVTPSAAGFLVEVEATNDTRVTAAQVEVEGVLTLPGGGEEVSAVTFDYVPGGGRRAGVLVFREDPGAGRLSISTRGHVNP